MKFSNVFAIAAFALVGVSLAALFGVLNWSDVLLAACAAPFLFGAVVTTYEYPVAGTTAPTAAQSLNLSAVSATIVASADGDTAATVTHNMAISVADLAAGCPWVILEPILSQALTALSSWIIATKTTNAVTLTKLTSTGSGNAAAQLRVIVQRPNSLVR